MELLPIGSVLCANNKKALVVGYHFETEDDKFVTSYLVVDFPMGYINTNSVGVVSVEADMDVIFEGYANDSYAAFIKNKQELYELSRNVTVSEWNRALEDAQQTIERNLIRGERE